MRKPSILHYIFPFARHWTMELVHGEVIHTGFLVRGGLNKVVIQIGCDRAKASWMQGDRILVRARHRNYIEAAQILRSRMPKDNPRHVRPGVYRHFEGQLFEVLGVSVPTDDIPPEFDVATHTSTLNDVCWWMADRRVMRSLDDKIGDRLVVYQEVEPPYKKWAKPLDDWLSERSPGVKQFNWIGVPQKDHHRSKSRCA